MSRLVWLCSSCRWNSYDRPCPEHGAPKARRPVAHMLDPYLTQEIGTTLCGIKEAEYDQLVVRNEVVGVWYCDEEPPPGSEPCRRCFPGDRAGSEPEGSPGT